MSTLEKNLYKNLKVRQKSYQVSNPVRSKSYRGVSTTDPNTKNFNYTDIELIKRDILNHFHIRVGEKLENPNFGTIIWDLLYEPFTPDVEQAIIANVTEIANADPRVTLTDVQVDSFESGIQIQLTLLFLEYNISEVLQYEFDLNNEIF